MGIFRHIERFIDRELARKNYLGSQSFLLKALCAAPALSLALLAELVEPFSRLLAIAIAILAIGSLFLMQIWIGARRAAGMGYFSTRRSQRFVGRMRRLRQRRANADHPPSTEEPNP
jgi:hypothetical protein